jgi:hypothetical protein
MPIREVEVKKDVSKPIHKGRDDRIGDPETRIWWKELKAFEKGDWCCEFFKELGLEWLQCETWDSRFHRLRFNYCPHCGTRI